MEVDYNAIYRKTTLKTIYQSPSYIEMLAQTLKVQKAHLICKNHKSALPLLTQNTNFGVVYNSLPFFGSCGGLIGSKDLCQELQIEIQKIINDRGFASINIVSNWNNLFPFDEIFQDFNKIERINTRKDLGSIRSKNQALIETYHQKTRNIVKLSMKQNFQIVDLSKDLDNVVRLHFEESRRRNRKAKPIEMWEYLFRNSRSGLEYTVYGAKHNDEILGFILYLYDTNTGQVEYFIPNSTEEGLRRNVNYLLLHSSIKDFINNGFKTLNFGGSQKSQQNLLRFKERWGGESFPYFYYNKYSPIVGSISEQVISKETPYFFVKPFSNQ